MLITPSFFLLTTIITNFSTYQTIFCDGKFVTGSVNTSRRSACKTSSSIGGFVAMTSACFNFLAVSVVFQGISIVPSISNKVWAQSDINKIRTHHLVVFLSFSSCIGDQLLVHLVGEDGGGGAG